LSKKKLKRVMVFGVFDRFHPGHKSFLQQAAKYGRVIAVVARDSAVKKIKGRMPRERERVRLGKIKKVERAVLGDNAQGTYAVIKKYEPDIICLGYDQRSLAKDLQRRMKRKTFLQIKLIRLKAYRPQRYHSSRM